jgi:ferredoxin--NADP+ reductase
LPDVPFHEKWGVILNEKGRVIDPESKQPCVGQYTAGWIKRGPSGVIGTNKPDAVETVNCMLEDSRKASPPAGIPVRRGSVAPANLCSSPLPTG